MKRTAQVSLSFLKLGYSAKGTFGSNTIAQLTANGEKFPDLPFTIVLLTLYNANLIKATTAHLKGGALEQTQLTTTVKIWNAAFKKTAGYVNFISNGDETLILEGGFIPTKNTSNPKPKNNFQSALNIAIPQGTKGGFTASSDKNSISKGNGNVFMSFPADATISQSGDLIRITLGSDTVYIAIKKAGEVQFDNLVKGNPLNVTVLSFNSSGCSIMAPLQEVIPQ